MALSFCPFCGGQVQETFHFCPSCGQGLSAVTTACRLAGAGGPSAGLELDHELDRDLGRGHGRKRRQTPLADDEDDAGAGSPAASPARRAPRRCKPRAESPAADAGTAARPGQAVPDPGGAGAGPAGTPRETRRKSVAFAPIGRQKPPLSPPAVAQPVVAQPAVAQPAVAQPAVAQPVVAQPAVTRDAKAELAPTAVSVPKPRAPKRWSGAELPIAPLDGEELEDITGQRWALGELLTQGDSTQLYLAQKLSGRSVGDQGSTEFLVKIGPKDGSVYTELNFYQRVARPDIVAKWVKLTGCEDPGILKIEGFGLHRAQHRFLVFEKPGRCLHAVLQEAGGLLAVSDAMAVARGLLAALEYVHGKEYAHSNLHAGSVYLRGDGAGKVLLADFSQVARCCPNGRHVEYRRGHREEHRGHVPLISLDAHYGAVPSRRGDVEMLGYCLLLWLSGDLPWAAVSTNANAVMDAKLSYREAVPTLIRDVLLRAPAAAAAAACGLEQFLGHAFQLPYDAVPDYALLRRSLDHPAAVTAAAADSPCKERKSRGQAAKRK